MKNHWRDMRQKLEATQMITQMTNMVKLANDTRNLTGQIMATGRELKNLTEKFNKDYTNIDMITKGEIEMLNRLVGQKDALAGNGYRPIFEFGEAYDASTASMRAPDGSLSVATTLRNSIDDGNYLRTMRTYNGFISANRNVNTLIIDHRIRDLLLDAKHEENAARMGTLALNLQVFGNTLKLMEARVKAIGTKEYVKEDQVVNHEEIKKRRDEITRALTSAAAKRAEAAKLLFTLEQIHRYDILEANDRWAYRQAKAKGPAWRPKSLAEETNLWVPKDKLGTF